MRRRAARFEAERGLAAGQLEFAVVCWRAFARRPGRPLHLPTPHLPGFDIWDERLLIERAIAVFHGRAAREIASLVKDADMVFLARTLHDPKAPRAWPWWRRRCRDLGDIMNVPSQGHDPAGGTPFGGSRPDRPTRASTSPLRPVPVRCPRG